MENISVLKLKVAKIILPQVGELIVYIPDNDAKLMVLRMYMLSKSGKHRFCRYFKHYFFFLQAENVQLYHTIIKN